MTKKYLFNFLLSKYQRCLAKLQRLSDACRNLHKQEILRRRSVQLARRLRKLRHGIAAATATSALLFCAPNADAQVVFTELTGAANPLFAPDIGFNSTPTFVDIDGDSDFDMFCGGFGGVFTFFKNTGTVLSPVFVEQTGVANPLNGIDVGFYSTPAFVDMDGDGDKDMFAGEEDGTINYYKNTGTNLAPVFTVQTGTANPLNGVDLGMQSAPAFVDIDGDSDLDFFGGKTNGKFGFFKNTGTVTAPVFVAQTGVLNPLNNMDVGDYSTPVFVDFDGDCDFDMISGEYYGYFDLFKNTGTPTSPTFVWQTTPANSPFYDLYVGYYSTPTFVDIDGDGDKDMFSGNENGYFFYFRNDTPLITGTEISVEGGSPLALIVDGDTTPATTDGTDFGTTGIGTPLAKTFAIKNLGIAPLTISSITVTGANASEFVVSGAPSSINTCAAAGMFTLTFTPTAAGLRTAVVHINNNDSNEADFDFVVQGNVLGACVAANFSTCPTNQTANVAINSCSAIKNYTAITAGSPTPTLTYAFTGATIGSGTNSGSGSTFNKGVTNVALTATNACGTSTCNFTVMVVDAQAPTVVCPSNVSVGTATNLCTGTAVLNCPTVTENCSATGDNALDFDGSSDYVNCGTSAAYDIYTSITLEAWINADVWRTESWQGSIIGKENWNDGPGAICAGYSLRAGKNGQLSFVVGDGNVWKEITSAVGVMSIGNWYHVAGTYDGTTMKIYINGNLVNSLTTPGSIAYSNKPLYIGNLFIEPTRYFNGKIDEVRIWNVARSQAQLKTSINNALAGNEPGLVAYWKFNQGMPNGTNTAVTTATATTGSNGTLNTFALTGTNSNWVGGHPAYSFSNNALAAFPVGTTPVVWTVTDASGNTSSCTQSVTVTDGQLPSITCPANVVDNSCTNTASWVVPTPTDNCTTTLQSPAYTPGSSFPSGSTVLTYTVTDAVGNTQSCSFIVTIEASTSGCTAPTGLESYNYGPTSAKLKWNINPCASKGYRISHKPASAATWILSNTYILNMTANGLLPATAYQWRVLSKCSTSNLSAYSATQTFNTLGLPVVGAAGQQAESIEASRNATELSISPNPTNGIVLIDLKHIKGDRAQMSVFDMSGAHIFSWKAVIMDGILKEQADLSDLPIGVYIIKIVTPDDTFTRTIMKE